MKKKRLVIRDRNLFEHIQSNRKAGAHKNPRKPARCTEKVRINKEMI